MSLWNGCFSHLEAGWGLPSPAWIPLLTLNFLISFQILAVVGRVLASTGQS